MDGDKLNLLRLHSAGASTRATCEFTRGVGEVHLYHIVEHLSAPPTTLSSPPLRPHVLQEAVLRPRREQGRLIQKRKTKMTSPAAGPALAPGEQWSPSPGLDPLLPIHPSPSPPSRPLSNALRAVRIGPCAS